jgi:hypothetical protein
LSRKIEQQSQNVTGFGSFSRTRFPNQPSTIPDLLRRYGDLSSRPSPPEGWIHTFGECRSFL